MTKHKLFEFGDWKQISGVTELKDLLESIRRSNLLDEVSPSEDLEAADSASPFLQFDGKRIRAKNYVGFVQTSDELIEIYPKVFKNSIDMDVRQMQSQVLAWLSRCNRWRFPFLQAHLGTQDFDSFPQLIIYLIANQFYDVLTTEPLVLYQPIQETLLIPRGRINFRQYATQGLARGNWHLIECDHEPFVYDNKVNRIIKFVTRLLLSQARHTENRRILEEILFILDEVEDIPAQSQEIDAILINSHYARYLGILDTCKVILDQQIYSGGAFALSQWCLLLPMEYIYEGYVASVVGQALSSDWKVEPQKSDLFLATDASGNQVFNLQHDILLTHRQNTNRKVIIDTKYKLRSANYKTDIKKGITQTDLYQMLSYATRRKATEVLLLYPNLGHPVPPADTFTLPGAQNELIKVTAAEIPFWSTEESSPPERALIARIRSLIS